MRLTGSFPPLQPRFWFPYFYQIPSLLTFAIFDLISFKKGEKHRIELLHRGYLPDVIIKRKNPAFRAKVTLEWTSSLAGWLPRQS